jgi:hypothetical protein
LSRPRASRLSGAESEEELGYACGVKVLSVEAAEIA